MIPTLAVEAPHGAVLDFTLLFAVILLGPVLVERARIPGIIGLLLGGFLIGPHALGLISPGNQTLPELGQFGLLYLMFGAGLELDLALLREHRRAAVTFGLLTFAAPFAGGLVVGLALGWEAPAALLLGSLLASHTLVLYPTVRKAGLSSNPAIASAVGATVLTDTIALVVLAGVAGSETGSGSTATVLLEVGIGLVVLVALGALGLPRLAELALRSWGNDRGARYLVSVVGFLVMAMVSEVFGIEGIVGAFFAGLALNRILPHHGPTMERIEFNGSALFIPVFLVSVGLLLDPAVMFTTETLGVAALITAACLGGKALAAWITVPLLGFRGPEAGVVFTLSAPQAAATLAATLVGFEIGLFGSSVVNAVLVLILVSIVVSTVVAPRFIRAVPPATPRPPALGARVLLVTTGSQPSVSSLRVAERTSRADGGVLEVAIVRAHGEPVPSEPSLVAVEEAVFNGCVDGRVHVAVDRTLDDAVAHLAHALHATVVVIDAPPGGGLRSRFAAPGVAPVPVVVVDGHHDGQLRHMIGAGAEVDGAAGEVVARVGRGRHRHVPEPASALAAASPGDVVVGPPAALAELPAAPDGVVLVQVTPAPADAGLAASGSGSEG